MSYTTIRLTDKFQIGETVEVYLNNTYLHDAVIVDKTKKTVDQLTDKDTLIDMGLYAVAGRDTIKDIYRLQEINWNTQLLTIYLLYANLK